MTEPSPAERAIRTRREPPRFRRVVVRRVEDLSPRLRRVVLAGAELEGFEITEPAASVRLLLPEAPGELVMPEWTGNQFELPDGRRAPIRTFTPRHLDPESLELTLDIVVHDGGVASDWAASAQPGDEVAVSGPGRGYSVDTDAPEILLAGDETAIPAISQLLEELPPETQVVVHVELADPEGRVDLPSHPTSEVTWHERPEDAAPGDSLVSAIEGMDEVPGVVWVAGEAAAMQRIRKHLFDVRGMSRQTVTARGYWKQGRSAT